jgi:copper ion binding protein
MEVMMAVEQFRVPEVSCEHCVSAITREVGALKGVQLVRVNLNDKSVRVEHDGTVGISTLVEAIKEAGYEDVAVLA